MSIILLFRVGRADASIVYPLVSHCTRHCIPVSLVCSKELDTTCPPIPLSFFVYTTTFSNFIHFHTPRHLSLIRRAIASRLLHGPWSNVHICPYYAGKPCARHVGTVFVCKACRVQRHCVGFPRLDWHVVAKRWVVDRVHHQ